MTEHLCKDTLQDLKRSGLTKTDAKILGIESLTAKEAKDLTGGSVKNDCYAIPYFDIEGREIGFARFKLLSPVGYGKKPMKYWQPKNSGCHLYIPRIKIQSLRKKNTIYITEGEKKAACLAKYGYFSIAIAGVDCYHSKGESKLLKDFDQINFKQKKVIIVFDSDMNQNQHVQLNVAMIAYLLHQRGAEVFQINLPPGPNGEKVGVDDFILEQGKDQWKQLQPELIDPKRIVDGIRNLNSKLKEREKRYLISEFVLQTLTNKGRFYIAERQSYYFDGIENRLLLCQNNMDIDYRTFINNHFGINASEQEWKFVFEHLLAYCWKNGEETKVHKFAFYNKSNNTVYIDRGNNEIVRVTVKGFKYVPNGTDGVLFRESQVQIIEPRRGKHSKAFLKVLSNPNFSGSGNLTRWQEIMLYQLWWWGLFFPSLLPTRPILLLTGEKGSSKTSSLRLVLKALIGNDAEVITFNRKQKGEDDLLSALTANHVIVIDNVDSRVDWLADVLAPTATGVNVTRRKLYTDIDNVVYRLDSFVAVTSRQPVSFTRDDIVDRLMILQCTRCNTVIPESQLIERVNLNRGRIWADILNTLPLMLKNLRRHQAYTGNFRLADFLNLALAIGPVLGYNKEEILQTFQYWEAEQQDFALEYNPITELLLMWATRAFKTEKAKYSGGKEITTGQLYLEVCRAWGGDTLPIRSARSFGMRLKNSKNELQRYFEIKFRVGRANQKLVKLSLTKEFRTELKNVALTKRNKDKLDWLK